MKSEFETKEQCEKWYLEKKKQNKKNSIKYLKQANHEAVYSIVAVAIKNKIIIKPKNCEECNSTWRIEAHHEDYEKPLDINWLCQKCHNKKHK